MIYKSLNENQRALVPLIFCLIFIYYFLKYRHSNIPKILLYSNLVLAFASILMFIDEIMLQNGYNKLVDNILYPIRSMDTWVLAYTAGAVCMLRGCFLHPKYKEKKAPLYLLIALLAVVVVGYIAARIIFTQ